MTDLIDLKRALATTSRAGRASIRLEAQEIADAYRRMRASAPRRSQRYLSPTRTGITSSGGASSRQGEHLAVALFNRGTLPIQGDGRLTRLDYQFPLKSARADSGIGKIDLLGLRDDGTLVVVELKIGSNQEDRRVALVEGLIYAAIVEANTARIADKLRSTRGHEVKATRPAIMIVAPNDYWTNPRATPTGDELCGTVTSISEQIPIDIRLMHLHEAALSALGLNGQPPLLAGEPFLSAIRP